MALTQSLLCLLIVLQLTTAQPSSGKMDGSDLQALLEIRNSLTDVNTNGQDQFFSSWNFSAPDPCSSFSGVTCDPLGHVSSLSLGSGPSGPLPLAGSLSPWPSSLTSLAQLILSPGIVTGPIPPQLGLLPSLQVISLPDNRLTGPIPTSLSLLTSLHTLDLSRNRLSGPIPPGLHNLKVLVLAHNDLSGPFPALALGPLLHLDVSSNRLAGELSLSSNITLKYLSASNNRMWGPLKGLDKITDELEYLDLSMNQFSGPIPNALFRPSLSTLLLQRNNLSGPVPLPRAVSGSYGSGSMVDLSHNALTGSIPAVLAGVETVFLNNNRLTGTVPREYGESVCKGTTTTLYLQHNYITGMDWERGAGVPDTASLCLTYNCMDPPPPVGLGRCPASAGDRVSRPPSQCTAFKNGRSE